MGNTYDPKRVINGTYGEVWIDGALFSEVYKLEAKIDFDKEDVIQCGSLMKGSKITGASGTGTVELHKVSSQIMRKVSNQLKNGQFPAISIVSKLKDPDAYGTEKVKLTGVTFDGITLADWEAGNLGSQSYSFTFTGHDIPTYISGHYSL